MKTHNFDDFSGTASGRRAATLLANHMVKPKQIFAKVMADATAIYPSLVLGRKYTTEMLCDPAAWATWTKAERRVAGMCMAYMVGKGVIPLTQYRTRRGGGKRRYCLPAGDQSVEKQSATSKRVKTKGYTLVLKTGKV